MDDKIPVDDKKPEPNIDSLVEERVKAALAEIKGKLDAAYEKRDLAAKELEAEKKMNEAIAKKVADKKAAAAAAEAEAKAAEEAPAEEAPAEA